MQVPEAIKMAAIRGEKDIVLDYCSSLNSAQDFRALKEHKILFKLFQVTNVNVFSDYMSIINTKFPTIANQEMAYIDFLIVIKLLLSITEEKINKELKPYKTCHIDYYLRSISAAINRELNIRRDKVYAQLKDGLDRINTFEDRYKHQLSIFHQLNGELVDLIAAYAVGVNYAFRSLKGSEFILPPEMHLSRIISLSSTYNSALWLLDQVSYGEIEVKGVDWESNTVHLDFKEESLNLARIASIRHNLSRIETNKDQFILKEWKEYFFDISKQLCGLYEFEYDVTLDEKELEDEIIHRLRDIDLKGSFLLVALQFEKPVLAHVFAAIYLICHSIVIEQVNKYIDYKQLVYDVPVDIFIEYLSNSIAGLEREQAIEAFDAFICTLPNRENQILLSKPFIRLSDTEVVGILPLIRAVHWHKAIQKVFIQGGKPGKLYGHLWEAYIGSIFEQYSWRILGKRIEVKHQTEVVTDIDLIVEKNGIVLLVQAKTVNECTTPYERWKTRNTIIKGIRQAQLAKLHIEMNPQKYKLPQNIAVLQGVVVVPLDEFNGWSNEDVPVISIDYLISMLNGAKFDLINEDGNVMTHLKYLTKDSKPEDVQGLLINPYFIRVQKNVLKKNFISEIVGGFNFIIPRMEPPIA